MKKSQMLGVIWNVLYQHTDVEEDFLPELSLILLETMEENGIKPPFSDLVFHKVFKDDGDGYSWDDETIENDSRSH